MYSWMSMIELNILAELNKKIEEAEGWANKYR
jgi:hypothetical protein